MWKLLLKLRYVVIIIVIFTLINSLAFIYLGVKDSLRGYTKLINKTSSAEWEFSGLSFMESLDSFFLAIVFFIITISLFKIFIVSDSKVDNLPAWIDILNINDLNILIWKSVVLSFIILSISYITRTLNDIGWHTLILPLVVLIFSIGLFIFHRK